MIKLSSQVLLFLPLALGIGIAMAIQTALNTQLRESLHSPLQAAFISFLIGTIVLGLLVSFEDATKPSLAQLGQIPWYLWLGGFLGVYAISVSIYTAPKFGFLSLSGVIIFGQLGMSMLLDHFGWLGNEKIPVNWQRVLGAIMIFAGVIFTFPR
ncbi:DMT family transporter [Acinetobacter soli]|uniref:DMT family transporter n=1 Tax=Acinetobacter soli TaxID=487316 RepID=UPI001F1623D4|nr:DMT family transporter [Acinetobacter soli]MCF3127348.1 DMT family transporter [Acinetobacter soli]